MIEDFRPRPSVVVDSGGGYQCFWRLETSVAVNGNYAELEMWNRRLEADLGGDACRNLDRIMRVPGTINIPNKKKRDAGRTEALAGIVWTIDETYSLDDFKHLPAPPAKPTTKRATVTPDQDTPQRFREFVANNPNSELARLWQAGPDEVDGDRSKFDWIISNMLVAEGYSDTEIASILMGYSGSKAAERGGDYLARTIANAREAVSSRVASSEDALALEFAGIHRDELRYVDPWGKWFWWDGTKWSEDKTRETYDMVRTVCRKAAAAAIMNNDKSSKALLKANTVAAVERLAKADRRMAATDDQWDSDPLLLNTPSGIVDLGENVGAISPHRSDAYMTKCTAAPVGGPCLLWVDFLHQIMNGDEELVAFLQRLCGYALTGSTEEHALFFLYGTGGNGKSVFIDTVSGVMGDYSRTAPMETFAASHGDRHPTELAGLRGARLVCATETEEGRRWSEAKVKQITGGDEISARFMRQDFFEFKPQFKLMIAGNHKPGLRSVDEAMQRRFHLVPFTVNIPKDQQDKELGTKLEAEWPGIMQWMIDGAIEWRRIGLSPPAAVVEATKAYMAEEDTTAEWLAECCSTENKGWDTTARLFESWKTHADDTGEFAGTKKRFSQKLIDRGFAQKRGGGGARGFKGIRVLEDHQRAALLKAEDG
jgi:putative DNA primase/helicase